MHSCVWYVCTYLYSLSLNGCHALLCIVNNRHDVTITTHAIKCHFLIWVTTVRQPTKRRCSCVLTLRYTFICVYWWTRQRIHNTLIVVDRYLRLMGDKNDSRLGGASSGIVLSPIRRRYRSTTSRCSGFLLSPMSRRYRSTTSRCSGFL